MIPESLVQRARLRERQVFLFLTILIAIIAGLSAVLFTLAIQGTQHLLFGLSPSVLRLILVPTLISLVTGVLLAKFFPEARGSGVPQTEVAYHLQQGRIRPAVPFGKFLTGVLCVGSGHSMGREGPSVQIGSGLASAIGQWFRLSPDRIKDLVPVGAAAALSAAFNTPVAAVLFALEEIIGNMNAGLIGSTVVASVTAVIVERSILGNEVLFRVPAYQLTHPAELLAYAMLGILGGLVSTAFCKGLLKLRAFFLKLPPKTAIFQPAIGGLAIGLMLVFVPEVMGVGYEYVDQALSGGMLLRTMLLLGVVKLVATIISYASGNAGGIFAPSLFLGAMFGGVVGSIVHLWAPSAGAIGAYALVGMGTLFAGIIRAPMTSVFMIFELTQDYQILVPLMIANLLSFIISRRFQAKPVYHALLEQNGIYLPEAESRSGKASLKVKDIMTSHVDFLHGDATIQETWQNIQSDGVSAYLLGSHDQLLGSITKKEIERAIHDGLGAESLYTIARSDTVSLHDDEPLEFALERFDTNSGIVAVTSRNGDRKVEGVVTLETIMEFIHKKPQ